MAGKSCGNCFFLGSPQGFVACTRDTPKPYGSNLYWPPVELEWCCGEWAGSDPNVYGTLGKPIDDDVVVNGNLTVNVGANGGIVINGGSGPTSITIGFDNGQPTISVATGTLVVKTIDSEIILHVPSGKGVLVEGDAVYATAFLPSP